MSIDIYTTVTDAGWQPATRPEVRVGGPSATLYVGGKHLADIGGKDRLDLACILRGYAEIFDAAADVADPAIGA